MAGFPSKVEGGNGNSGLVNALQNCAALKKVETEIVKVMLPVYLDESDVSEKEREFANYAWNLILTDRAPVFLSISKGMPEDAPKSALELFQTFFFNRLFDIHPLAQDFLEDKASREKFLVRLISVMFLEQSDPIQYRSSLSKLVEIQNTRGVKAVEYGTLGSVLFWSLKATLGDAYTVEVQNGWVKLFSRLLKIVVPLAVMHEMKNGKAQELRLAKHEIEIGIEHSTQQQ